MTTGYKAVTGLTRHQKKRLAKRNSRTLLPALVAVGGVCGLATMPSNALELGEVTMESTLGQPLRASIAYALNPNEQLYDFCIYLRPGAADAAIPSVSRARVSITEGAIILTGNTAVRDPLLNVQVAVDCPYTPHLVREYTLIVDPVLPDTTTRYASSGISPATSTTVAQPAHAAVRTRTAQGASAASGPRAPAALPIPTDSEYRVQTGDSISNIAARIEGRTIGLWPAINALVAANPHAFLENDANRLMAGSVLVIPNLRGEAVAAETPALAAVTYPVNKNTVATAAPVESKPSFESPLTSQDSAAEIVNTATEYAPVGAAEIIEEAALEDVASEAEVTEIPATVASTESELRPGDVVMAPVAAATSAAPIVQTSVINGSTSAASATSGAWSWLAWLGGSGIALILGLLFFGKGLRQRFGSVAIGPEQAAPIEPEEEPTQTNPVIGDVDFQFDDAIPSDAISLDADLDAGTGLQGNSDVDVAQDFGFSASGQVDNEFDFEITEEAARDSEESTTDIIEPSHRAEESSILEAEITADDEDYDMSMIVDATKQSIDEFDATAKDLQAVQIDATSEDEYMLSDDTLNRDVDLEILEQDYQDEFTATMALNQEIEKAAAELAKCMHEDEQESTEGSADAEQLEPTAEMPVRSKDPDITAELTANIPTNIDAVNDDEVIDDDITSKMAAAGSDITVEMHVESGKVDTKNQS